ncbi:MAG: BrnA antitoxin family protein [Clostridiales bacterium]|nr:BrnA antitoxin family protein [Candidatus Crickella equi]
MRDEYDFSNAIKNPYAARMKQQITINLEKDTIKYFKELAEETGIPYQSLINMYLAECVREKKKPHISWK